MDVTDCINFILTSTQNAVSSYFKDRLQEYDTTPAQYALLRCLWRQDGQTPSQLAHALHLDTSSVTGTLGRLEKKGLIERTFNREDRRSIHVHLGEQGKLLWEQIDRVIDEANAEILSGIDPADYERLYGQLRTIEHNAKELR